MFAMGLPRVFLDGLVRHFTTDQSVRAGVMTAAWAAAASYSRGLLPRTPVQQAAALGVSATAYYALGTTTWATVSSVASVLTDIRDASKARFLADLSERFRNVVKTGDLDKIEFTAYVIEDAAPGSDAPPEGEAPPSAP